MQIQVRTSINVRSSIVPPSSVDANDHYPGAEERSTALEKVRSKPSIPLLPSLQDMAAARFKVAQRPPPGSRLSAWLHGFSVVDYNRNRPRTHNRNVSQTNTYCYHQPPRRRSRERVTGLRPANSTRGVIDPVHSPPTGAWQIPSSGQHTQNQCLHPSSLDAYQITPRGEVGYQPPKVQNSKVKGKGVVKKQKRACFPRIKDPKIRQKAIGCLLFGTILIIVLTICTFSCPTPILFQTPILSLNKRSMTDSLQTLPSQPQTQPGAPPSTASSSSASSSSQSYSPTSSSASVCSLSDLDDPTNLGECATEVYGLHLRMRKRRLLSPPNLYQSS